MARWRATWPRLRGALPTGERTDLAPLPVQYADYTLWQRDAAGGRERPAERDARQLGYWTRRRSPALPEELDLPDRPAPAGRAVLSRRSRAVRCCPAELHGGLLALAHERRRQHVHGAARRAGGAAHTGSAPATTSRRHARSPAAPTRRSRSSSASSSTRWCCAPTSPAIRASPSCSARVRAVDLAAFEPPGRAVRAVVEALNPARSLRGTRCSR